MTQQEPVHEQKLEVGPSGRKIVYDKDGKPCRTCNSLLDFRAVTKNQKAGGSGGAGGAGMFTVMAGAAAGAATAAATSKSDKGKPSSQEIPPQMKACPPDVEELGRSSWTLLHSIAATYAEAPSSEQQNDLSTFIRLFSKIYPCWFCAADFEKYISKNQPKVKTQEEFGRWLCDAHNEVNVKLGKPKFDCNLWKQRWKDGWEDGSCD